MNTRYDAALSHPGTKRISEPGAVLICPKCQWASRHHEFFSPLGVCNFCAKYMRPSELAKLKHENAVLKRSLKKLRCELVVEETSLGISTRLNNYGKNK